MHTRLSMVEIMITPADLARMLHAAADTDAGKHTQPTGENEAADALLYTSESKVKGGIPTPASVFARVKITKLTAAVATHPIDANPGTGDEDAERRVPSGPTPAMMPRRRASDGPTTFASLDAQELPVVREYSAGGLVFDEHNRVAVIARHSRSGHLEWCLPKGHIEKGETPQQTAVREVHEETGILGEVVDSIATIDYWFTGTSQRVHKLVHHFALRQIGGDLTVEGDPDHEAEDAIWVRFEDLDDVLSYPNERKIAWLYAKRLNRQGGE